MTRFASALDNLKGLGALAIDLDKHVPTESRMAAAARRVADIFEMPTRPSDEELLRALRRFEAWCNGKKQPLEADWALAPWIVLQGSPRLLNRDPFASEFAKRMTTERLPRLLPPLIHSYLRDFEVNEPAVAAAGALIERSLARHGTAWAVRWRERTRAVRLFEADGLIGRLTGLVLGGSGDARLVLRELGFTTELVAHSGLHEPLGRSLALSVAARLQADLAYPSETVDAALGSLRTGAELRFPGQRVELAETLLAPFATKDLRNLSARAALARFFDEVYGDPRSHPKKWRDVSADARKTITRWLARKALDLFFDILSATADPIWRWRRAFWLALERHGVIDDAWPVFGRQALAYLARNPEQKQRVAGYAVLAGAERKQSVMLMRIDRFLVAEWSHAGSVRIWVHDDEWAPVMGDKSYQAYDIRSPCLHDQRHDGTDHYAWQRDLADWLAKRIGVRIGINEMKPNG